MAAGFIHTIKSIRIKNILDSDLKKNKQNKAKTKQKQNKTKTKQNKNTKSKTNEKTNKQTNKKTNKQTINFLCILYHCLDINYEKIFPILEF